MRIMVTGGCGFIGSNFILQQIKLTDNFIFNIDKLTYAGNLSNLQTLAKEPRYKFAQGDICDSKFVTKSINTFKPNYIVHFAAESHVDKSIENPMSFIQTNILGTANIINISHKYSQSSSLRFLHVSTDEVYGSLGKSGLFNEKSPYNPSSPYSSSKASSDHLVRAWFKTYNFPAIITNCSNNYGPYQYPEKLIPLIISNCVDKKNIPVYGNGENIRDWLYVEDHCGAIYAALLHGKIGHTYNIGGNYEMQNIQIVKKICNILDNIKPQLDGKSYSNLISFINDRPGHDYRYAIDSTKIEEKLGWAPKETFETGLNKTIKWYLKNEDWWREILNKKLKKEDSN
jgi:dTDP-glucose 4,6-dehydratase